MAKAAKRRIVDFNAQGLANVPLDPEQFAGLAKSEEERIAVLATLLDAGEDFIAPELAKLWASREARDSDSGSTVSLEE